MEEFKRIFENYEISNLGNVRSYLNNGHGCKASPHPIKSHLQTAGYLSASFRLNGKYKQKLIHILVAEQFLPNPEKKPQVNHKDGNKLNNCVNNLQWVTPKENMKHAKENNLMPAIHPNLNRKGALSKTSKKVYQYTKDGELIKIWDSTKCINRELKYDASFISKCCKNKLKEAYGFVWTFKEWNGNLIDIN